MGSLRLDDGVALAALGAYLCNRYLVSFDFLMPYEVAHYHFGDFCGGVLFPAYVNWLTRWIIGRDVVTTLPREIVCGLACGFVWEVLAPAVLPFSTGARSTSSRTCWGSRRTASPTVSPAEANPRSPPRGRPLPPSVPRDAGGLRSPDAPARWALCKEFESCRALAARCYHDVCSHVRCDTRTVAIVSASVAPRPFAAGVRQAPRTRLRQSLGVPDGTSRHIATSPHSLPRVHRR